MILLWLAAGLLAQGAEVEEPVVSYGWRFHQKRKKTREDQEEKEREERDRLREALRVEAERLAAEEIEALEEKARQEWKQSLNRLVRAYTLPDIPAIQIDITAIAQNIWIQWQQKQRQIQDEDDAIALILLLA